MIIKEFIESVTVNKIFVSWLDIRDTFKEALSDISPGEYLVTNPLFVDIAETFWVFFIDLKTCRELEERMLYSLCLSRSFE